jgi:hypothetical protein
MGGCVSLFHFVECAGLVTGVGWLLAGDCKDEGDVGVARVGDMHQYFDAASEIWL